MNGKRLIIPALLVLLLIFMSAGAYAGEAENLTGSCKIGLCKSKRTAVRMTDGQYTTYWESEKTKNPYVTITSDRPVYGLYLCFRAMPEHYEIQAGSGSDKWTTVCDGDTRYWHVFYPLDGVKKIRIIADGDKKCVLGFNELFVFGEGEVPGWVQRWKEPAEKADVLFLVAHPDDELIFLGGAIPTYAVEMKKNVVVAYLSWSNTTRRSEALNGLWEMGVRNYPVFGGFSDTYSSKAADAYKKIKGGKKAVLGWVTGLFRTYRPEVVVTHDINGEYGHGQHKMIADAAINCYDAAADGTQYTDVPGAWQVKKLYIHLYGDETNRTAFDWTVPLESMDGRTGLELASSAYSLHKTQATASVKIRGKWHKLSVEETGSMYPNTAFGLYRSEVGDDVTHLDFLENIN